MTTDTTACDVCMADRPLGLAVTLCGDCVGMMHREFGPVVATVPIVRRLRDMRRVVMGMSRRRFLTAASLIVAAPVAERLIQRLTPIVEAVAPAPPMISDSDISALLKKIYTPFREQLFPISPPLFADIQKSDVRWSGAGVYFDVVTA